jgi:hypothetical protein
MASLSGLARAQTTGTVFPNNQDPSNTPAEQSMQEVGGPSSHIGVDVQDQVKPVPANPATLTTHRRRTVVKTRAAKPASSAAPAGVPK